MAVSNAKKKANAKWDSENMTTLACKIKREQADKFKAYCTGIGKTSNAILRDYVLNCIGEAAEESPQKPAGAAQGIGAILTPATLETAQEAAQAAGETVSEFICRAVDVQAQRDRVLQAMRPKEKAKGACSDEIC